MTIEIIINPKAGNKVVKKVIKEIEKSMSDSKIIKTTHKNHAIEIAKKSKAEIIVAVGGDGTINEVINGIIHSKRKKKAMLGVIPIGTSNVVARGLKIPTKSTKKAIEVIKDRKKHRKIDIGVINDRYFVIGAGIGIDAHMYKNVEPKIKKLFGEVAYPLSYIKSIFSYKPIELTIRANRKTYIGYYVLAWNLGVYPNVIKVVKNIKDNDGYLDVLIFKKLDIINQFKYIFGLLTNTHKKFDIEHIKAKSLVVEGKEVLAHADAELIGKTPVKISVLKEAVEIIC